MAAIAVGSLSLLGWALDVVVPKNALSGLAFFAVSAIAFLIAMLYWASGPLSRMEEAQRQSETRYQELFESLPDALVATDRKGQIVQVNAQVEQLFGYSREELLGEPVEVLLPERFRGRHVAHLAKYYLKPRTRQMGAGLELYGRRRDGSEFPANIMLSPMGTSEDLRVVAAVRDITDRRQAEEALRQSEARLSLALDAARMGAWDSNLLTGELIWSESLESLFGLAPGAFAGTREAFYERVHPEDREAVRQAVTRAVAERVDFNVEHRIVQPDGAVRWIASRGRVFQDPAGAAAHMFGISADITERKHLEQQLFQAQKMEAIGTLAGGVAHDFNNILTSIIGYAQMAQFDEGLSPQTREYISKIPEQGQRAARLISQLLAFSRWAVVEKQPLHLLSLVKETARMLRRTLPEHIAIRLNIPDHLSTVSADPTQMQQVLMNLCVNAGQAMPEGGELTVSLENVTLDQDYCRRYIYARPGDYVCLSVRDTGVGMTPEVQEHIFEPFFTTKGVGEGTGLGLAMVYGIVKEHQGHINVYSEAGKGSEFKVYIPAIAAETTPRIVSTEEPPRGGTETLLLVEDDARVMGAGKVMLERLGYTVLTAVDGEEALQVYHEHRDEIALVLADMVMPNMGGPEFYEALIQINPAARVLLMSGYSLKEKIADLQARGLRGFVQKPFDFNSLGRIVRQTLDEQA